MHVKDEEIREERTLMDGEKVERTACTKALRQGKFGGFEALREV